MIRKHTAACLMATMLAAAPAFAQTGAPSGSTDRPLATGSGSTTSGSPAMNPGTSGGTSASPPPASMSGTPGTTAGSGGAAGASGSMGSGSSGAASPANRGNFVERQQPGQFLASRLVGTTVYGPNNERVGDVNDVLMDRDGKAQALVIGVGGFLGIGEKDVAVPFSGVEFASGASGTGAGGNTSGTAGGTGGSTGTAGGLATTAGSNSGNSATPDRVVLRMTRDQLNAAPQFLRIGDNTSGGNTNSGANRNAPAGASGTGGK